MSKCRKAKGKRQKVKVKREAQVLSLPFFLLPFIFCLLFSGCRQDMQDQPRYEAYESSTFFKDGLSSRSPVEGTVPRGYLRSDKQLFTGQNAQANANNQVRAVGASNSNAQTGASVNANTQAVGNAAGQSNGNNAGVQASLT